MLAAEGVPCPQEQSRPSPHAISSAPYATPGCRTYLTVPKALSRIDTQGVLFFLGILMSIASLDSAGILRDLAVWMDGHLPNQVRRPKGSQWRENESMSGRGSPRRLFERTRWAHPAGDHRGRHRPRICRDRQRASGRCNDGNVRHLAVPSGRQALAADRLLCRHRGLDPHHRLRGGRRLHGHGEGGLRVVSSSCTFRWW